MRILSRVSPYLLFLLLPGSAVLLPIYARWLDRQHRSHNGAFDEAGSGRLDQKVSHANLRISEQATNRNTRAQRTAVTVVQGGCRSPNRAR